MSKFLVTGAAGFIGSHMVNYLLNEGHTVIALDNYSSRFLFNDKAINIFFDLTTPLQSIQSSLEGVECVFHFAAVARIPQSIRDPNRYYTNNLLSTINILSYCMENNIHLVYSSSSSVMTPTNPYAHSKLIGEDMCKLYNQLYNLNVQCLRYFNVYGDNMLSGEYSTVLQKFFDSDDEITIYGDGSQKRDFTHVFDVCVANEMMISENKFQIYDVGSKNPYSINEIAKVFRKKINKSDEGFVGVESTCADNTIPGWEPTYDVIKWLKTKLNEKNLK